MEFRRVLFRSETEDVHIAFDDEEAPLGARGRCCAVDIEQRSPLVENRRVGAVEIFRLPVAEDPAAESDDDAEGVVDRDYDAPAKKLVEVAGIGVALPETEMLGIQIGSGTGREK